MPSIAKRTFHRRHPQLFWVLANFGSTSVVLFLVGIATTSWFHVVIKINEKSDSHEVGVTQGFNFGLFEVSLASTTLFAKPKPKYFSKFCFPKKTVRENFLN